MVVLTLSVSCYTISVRKVFLGPPIQDLASQPHVFFMFNLKSGFKRLEARENSTMATPHLWKVTCRRNAQKAPAGLTFEIIKSGTNAPPSPKEISAAIKQKYGINISETYCGRSYFEAVEVK